MKLELCKGNEFTRSIVWKKMCQEFQLEKQVTYNCLGHCGACFTQSLALINSKLHAADTPKELAIILRGELLPESAGD
ncbi:DUF1450 domain-containing protein [Kroppenstedtia pulmonis]|uniref:DUF1450 domain-containing protein n=1 Tax=Kroppenstedtia pulmonis TaxID=1380685 RepID=A0A7D3XQN9_9BACL|nr:DUF1450 domain-containing protein [Kroppenstedtia pulmonis]QKG83608.1 DUF1450 domain-containing protein [Kroppenstedtia pulmonis]